MDKVVAFPCCHYNARWHVCLSHRPAPVHDGFAGVYTTTTQANIDHEFAKIREVYRQVAGQENDNATAWVPHYSFMVPQPRDKKPECDIQTALTHTCGPSMELAVAICLALGKSQHLRPSLGAAGLMTTGGITRNTLTGDYLATCEGIQHISEKITYFAQQEHGPRVFLLPLSGLDHRILKNPPAVLCELPLDPRNPWACDRDLARHLGEGRKVVLTAPPMALHELLDFLLCQTVDLHYRVEREPTGVAYFCLEPPLRSQKTVSMRERGFDAKIPVKLNLARQRIPTSRRRQVDLISDVESFRIGHVTYRLVPQDNEEAAHERY